MWSLAAIGITNTLFSWNHFDITPIAQCFYREGHAYILKNPMVGLMGPTTKFL